MAKKEQLELENAQAMNDEAIERIKNEAEETSRSTEESEDIWFENGRKIKLLDGKEYWIKPSKLGVGRRLMKLLGTISLDSVLINFLETGNEQADSERVNNLYEVLRTALYEYPHITNEYLDEHCDFAMVSQILNYIIEVNSLKK